MKNFQIENLTSGMILGTYQAEDERGARLAMARDAGYSSVEEMEGVAPTRPGEILVTEVDEEEEE